MIASTSFLFIENSTLFTQLKKIPPAKHPHALKQTLQSVAL